MPEDENNKIEKSALIIVGGAYKSTYYTGAMQALEEIGIARNFDAYVGISAGAPILAYFLANQLSDMPSIWKECVPKKDLYNPKNLFVPRKPILNLDYLVDEVFGKVYPLNIENIKKSGKEFFIPIMHYETGVIRYADVHNFDIFQAMKAAMSIPWLTRKFYEINNKKYVDAGIAEQLVIQKMINDGYSKILVMVSNPVFGQDLKNFTEIIIEKAFLLFNPATKKIVKYLLFENNNYYEALIKDSDNKIVQIHPEKSFISRFENNKEKITKNLESGYFDVMNNKELLKSLEIFRK